MTIPARIPNNSGKIGVKPKILTTDKYNKLINNKQLLFLKARISSKAKDFDYDRYYYWQNVFLPHFKLS